MKTKSFTDQLGNKITIPFPPKRIISLVPSQTELLFHLGLDEEIIGLTKFCIHPKKQFKLKTKIGGTKQLKLEIINDLKPDLIIANKEENDRSQIEALQRDYPVWISDIKNLEDALHMINEIGLLINKIAPSRQLTEQLTQEFNKLATQEVSKRVAYFIWRKPYMIAAKDTFIDDILKRGGYQNCFENKTRYPEIEKEELAKQKPDYIFLSSEPYPFKQKHVEELKAVCPNAIVKLVDGELFSWYGNRLLKTCDYLNLIRGNLSS